MIKELLKLKHSDITRKVNYVKIPCTAYQMNDEGAHKFNELYKWIKTTNFNKIIRTPSGGISIERRNFKPPMWDVRTTKSLIELTIIIKEGCWRIQFRTIPKKTDEGTSLYGSACFKLFREKCKEFGIDLDEYQIDNGKEVKEEIERHLTQQRVHRPFFFSENVASTYRLHFFLFHNLLVERINIFLSQVLRQTIYPFF